MLVEIEHHNNYPAPLGFKTFIKYYPTRYEVSRDYQDNRRVVYSFKDGAIIPAVDTLFTQAISDLKNQNRGKSFWLCTIPSSTIDRTNERYRDFCSRISNMASVNNGFSMLMPKEDRDEVHAGGTRNYDRVLSSIQFDPNIRGKNIILIDDVITTGKSFRLISTKLRQLGASSVYGIVLAKTHWLEETAILF